MKRVFCFISTVFLMTFACSNDDNKFSLTLSDDWAELKCEGGMVEITVTANTDWLVSFDADWLEVEASGKTGNGVIQIKVHPNESTGRVAIIAVTALTAGINKEIIITQKGIELIFSVSIDKIKISSEGGIAEIKVFANTDWSVETDPYLTETKRWFDVDTSNITGNGSIMIRVEPNKSIISRGTRLFVKTIYSGIYVLVYQVGKSSNWMSYNYNSEKLWEHNKNKITITEGVSGTLVKTVGNCMPMYDMDYPTCFQFPVKRKILIYEYTTLNETVRSSFSVVFYEKVHTKLIATTTCDDEGFFEVELKPGRYSLFVQEKGLLYGNLYDGHGGIAPVIVELSKVSERYLNINYAPS